MLFPAQQVIVELDGYEFHGTRQAFERDRERDATTLAAGYRTVRITWERLTEAAGEGSRPPERDHRRPVVTYELLTPLSNSVARFPSRAPFRIRGARPTAGVASFAGFPKRKLVIGSTVAAAAAFAGGAVAATQGVEQPASAVPQRRRQASERHACTAQLRAERRGPRSAQRGRQGGEAHPGSGQRAQAAHPAGSPRPALRSSDRPAREAPAGLATARSDSASAARCSSDPTRRRSPSRSTSA